MQGGAEPIFNANSNKREALNGKYVSPVSGGEAYPLAIYRLNVTDSGKYYCMSSKVCIRA